MKPLHASCKSSLFQCHAQQHSFTTQPSHEIKRSYWYCSSSKTRSPKGKDSNNCRSYDMYALQLMMPRVKKTKKVH